MLLTPENICNRSYKRENVKKESDFTQIPSLRVCFYHKKAYFGSKILLEMAFFGSNWPFLVKINVKLTDSSVVVLIWGITRLISWFPILTDFIFSLFDKCLWFFVVFCVFVRVFSGVDAWNFSQYLFFMMLLGNYFSSENHRCRYPGS